MAQEYRQARPEGKEPTNQIVSLLAIFWEAIENRQIDLRFFASTLEDLTLIACAKHLVSGVLEIAAHHIEHRGFIIVYQYARRTNRLRLDGVLYSRFLKNFLQARQVNSHARAHSKAGLESQKTVVI